MAVAVPRPSTAPSRPRRKPAPRPISGVKAAPRRRATTHHSRTARASVGGRLAPFWIATLIALVGVVLSVIVFLHVSSLRSTMQAGELRTQVEATQNDASNIQAETEQRLADGRVEQAAAAYGMVLVPSQAMRTLPIKIPKDLQTH
ncbi:MAG: hypothetical protein EXQ67_00780 [Thermoleophilia bacterium]|nr:hypothetical protein [Thermoleophilia bacterium]